MKVCYNIITKKERFKQMKKYEVTIMDRKNTIWSNIPIDQGKVRYIVVAENKKQAIDFAYELFQPEYKMSRDKVKITADIFIEKGVIL